MADPFYCLLFRDRIKGDVHLWSAHLHPLRIIPKEDFISWVGRENECAGGKRIAQSIS